MNTTNYKLEKGDTVRVIGCHGRLFNGSGSKLELADGVALGVECVLITGEDGALEVGLPYGILDEDAACIHIACIELVKKRELKPATIKNDPRYDILVVRDGEDEHFLAKIWYESIPEEVAEKCAKLIKAAYDTSVLNNPPSRDLRKLL